MNLQTDKIINDHITNFLKKFSSHKMYDLIDNFRMVIDITKTLDLGQKDNELLGPYNLPSVLTNLTNSLYIKWKNKKISNLRLSYNDMLNIENEFNFWYEQAYYDEWAADIISDDFIDEAEILSYKMYDDKVEKFVSGNIDDFFKLNDYLNLQFKGLANLITTNISGTINRRLMIFGSNPLTPTYDFNFSAFGLVFSLDNQYYDYSVKRRIIDLSDIKSHISNALKYYPFFTKANDNSGLSKATLKNVIFIPQVLDAFIEKYLVLNLIGKAVVEKQSRFLLSEFKANEKVLRDDISLKFDINYEDYDINNLPLTHEGVLIKPTYFIQNGRLKTPILDLKYAKKAELDPTPYLSAETFLSNSYSLKFETNEYEEVNNIISDTSDGYIIFNVLGMHTQDHTSGNFSLSVPYALEIKNGKFEKIVKLLISGNFFEILNSYHTKFLNWYTEGDALLTKCMCL